jgi:hypothetical protein
MYRLNLAQFNLYPLAEALLGEFAASISKGEYRPATRDVLHDKPLSRLKQAQIKAYVLALMSTNYGAG